MTDLPSPATPDTAARVKAQYFGILDEIDQLKSRIVVAQEHALKVRGVARTPEDDIRVTVGPRGEMTGLEIDPRAYRKLGPSELAAEILELCDKARKDAAEKVSAVMGTALHDDFDVEAFLDGRPQERVSRFPEVGQSVGEWLDRLRSGMP